MKSVLTKLKAAQPEVVLISTYWKKNEEAEAFEVIDEIRDTISSDLVVFSPPVFYSQSVPSIALKLLDDESVDFPNPNNESLVNDFLHHKVKARAEMLERHAISRGYQYINRWDVFCFNDKSCPVFTENGGLLKGDKFHMTLDGAEYFGERLKSYLEF